MNRAHEQQTESRREKIFPGWGAAALPAGVLMGLMFGGGLGAYFGIPGIGAAVGAAIGISVGMALLAAAVVTASSRTKKQFKPKL